MGKTFGLRSPAVRFADRSNQEHDGEPGSTDSAGKGESTPHGSSHSQDSSWHDSNGATPRSGDSSHLNSKSVVVLRRCEDINVRTGGFQKIEEAAHRLDVRRQRPQQQQQQ